MSDLVTLSHKPRKIVGKLLKGIINLVSPSQPEKRGFKSFLQDTEESSLKLEKEDEASY